MKSASIDEHFVLSTTVNRLLIESFQMQRKLILKKRRKKINQKCCKWVTNVLMMLLSSSLYIKYVFAHHFELKLSK